MRFEDKLKNEIKRELRERADKFTPYFTQGDQLSDYINDIFRAFSRILDVYNYSKYRNTKSDREIWNIGEEFQKCFTDNKLKEMYEKTDLSEEELNCVRYVELTREWLNDYMRPVNEPITDILLRRELIKQYGQEAMPKLVKIMQEEIPTSDMMARRIYKHLSKLFSGELYSEMPDILEKTIDDMAEEQFLNKINCGGYALNIDTCVFPFGYDDFSKNVSTVLERFSFTRLLGDKQLGNDEYLVLYRANKDGSGHHFVRIDDDNIIREKDGSSKEREFESWKRLEECKEAVFAVKKEHTMFGYDIVKVNSDGKEGLNFEETINRAIHNKHNTFNYHGHEYSFKKSQEGEIIIASGNSIVADVLIEDGECIAEIREGKENYVENCQPPIGLVIKEGKLINREIVEKLNNTGYIIETEEMKEQEKYNHIDRKFTFNISTNDRNNIRNMLYEKIYEKSPYKDKKQVNTGNKLEYAQTTLYYNIGMLDYDIAFKNTNMIDYLHKRADYSVMLQVVEEEMAQLGISTSNKLQINKNIEGEIPGLTKKQNEPHFDDSIVEDRITVKVNSDKELTIPSEIFHGTNEDFLKENIGKKDADGKYYIRDGVIYWAFEENTAKRYGNNILKHKFDENDKFICIDDTDGGIALRCQEDLYKQSKAGTKYVICSNPHRSDVMDISNYADFVDTRDEKLVEKLIGLGKLAKPFYDKNVSYSEYMKELEKAREQEKDKEER